MPQDALIVLANEMGADGTLTDESLARAGLTLRIARERPTDLVVTCGWPYRPDSAVAIADAFKDHLVGQGLPAERIVPEVTSRDTVGDAVFTRAKVIDPRGIARLRVVTSAYHVARTRRIFGFVYGDGYDVTVLGATVPEPPGAAEREAASLAAFRRTFAGVNPGDLPSILEALRTRHPFYDGTVHPALEAGA
jgi:uncharacterized SAM-binding protein YcdF (DUF218 family)